MMNLKTGEVGMVRRIIRFGDQGSLLSQVGDLDLDMQNSVVRTTNKYDEWVHVAHDDQTCVQRLESWKLKPYEDDATFGAANLDAGLRQAIDGMLNLLPNSVVDWRDGPWPDTLNEMLGMLAEYIDEQFEIIRESHKKLSSVRLDADGDLIGFSRPRDIDNLNQAMKLLGRKKED